MAGCGKSGAPTDPADAYIESFTKQYREGVARYGNTLTKGDQVKAAQIDCQTYKGAMTAQSESLGDMASRLDSAYYLITLGCSVDAVSGATYHESMRRAVMQRWLSDMGQFSEVDQLKISDSPVGKLIGKLTVRYSDEIMACQWRLASEDRSRGRSGRTVSLIRDACDKKQSWDGSGVECEDAWVVSSSMSNAVGMRDYWAWTSDLFARYISMLNVCSPSSAVDYVRFHQQVPPEIFSRHGYRLKIAIDPITQCGLQGGPDGHERRKGYHPNVRQDMAICAKAYNYRSLYVDDIAPRRMGRPMFSQPDGWVLDGQDYKAKALGPCEQAVANQMTAFGLNPVSREALKNYCGNIAKAQRLAGGAGGQ